MGQKGFCRVELRVLSDEIRESVPLVSEFDFIRAEAEKMGVKVYLFGGTAVSFAHYVRLNLERKLGSTDYMPERFDFDFTNIYRGNQDLDLVIDGSSEQADALTNILISKYPNFIGAKSDWEIRLLKSKKEDKVALLDNPDFLNQHTDSNSTGLIELTNRESPLAIRDLRDWRNEESLFLEDVANGKISFYFSLKHESTSRYKQGNNPPLLSVVRFVAKLAQFELKAESTDLEVIKEIIKETDVEKLSSYSRMKALEFGLKALLNSPNIELAYQTLERLGLREKLIEIDGNRIKEVGTVSWWMDKKPLSSFEMGKGRGLTAKELGIERVAHETNTLDAYESIIKSSKGGANVFVSRPKKNGEQAAYGEGFYTRIGEAGARGTNITIQFLINPEAKRGTDFELEGEFVIVKNKNAISVIQDSIDISIGDYFSLLIDGKVADHNLGYIERLSRKFSRDIDIDYEACRVQKNRIMALREGQQTLIVYRGWFALKCAQQFPEVVDHLIESKKHLSIVMDSVILNSSWPFNPKWLEAVINLDLLEAQHIRRIRGSGMLFDYSEEIIFSPKFLKTYFELDFDPKLAVYVGEALKKVSFEKIQKDLDYNDSFGKAKSEGIGLFLALLNSYKDLPDNLVEKMDDLFFKFLMRQMGYEVHEVNRFNVPTYRKKKTKLNQQAIGEFLYMNSLLSAEEIRELQIRVLGEISKKKWKNKSKHLINVIPVALSGGAYYMYSITGSSAWQEVVIAPLLLPGFFTFMYSMTLVGLNSKWMSQNINLIKAIDEPKKKRLKAPSSYLCKALLNQKLLIE